MLFYSIHRIARIGNSDIEVVKINVYGIIFMVLSKYWLHYEDEAGIKPVKKGY